MKRNVFLVVVALVLVALAPSAGATEPGEKLCHRVAAVAHQAAVLGHALPAIPARCPGRMDQPPAGSGNWPVNLAGAQYAVGEPHNDLLPWLRGGVWSHNGRENGAFYEPWNTRTAFLVRYMAERRGDRELTFWSGRYLRAQWAKEALAATPHQPIQVIYRIGDFTATRKPLNRNRYRGPFIHRVGNRHAEDPERGRFAGAWVESKDAHALLAWAADWPGRRFERVQFGEMAGGVWTVQQLTGKKYRQTVSASFFGLTADERRTLRSFLQNPTNGRLAREVASWLDGYPQLPGVTSTYRRYMSGVTLSVLSRSSHASKGAANVVLGGREGATEWLLPADFARKKVPTTHGAIEGHHAVATAPGRRLTTNLNGLGPIAWEAHWTPQGVRFVGDSEPAAQVATGSPPPPSSRPSVPSAPIAEGEELRRALVALDLWAKAQDPESERVIRSVGGMLSTLDAWTQEPTPGHHAALFKAYASLGVAVAGTEGVP